MNKYEKEHFNHFVSEINKGLEEYEQGRYLLVCLDDIEHMYKRKVRMRIMDNKTGQRLTRTFVFDVYRYVEDHSTKEKDYRVSTDMWNWVIWFVCRQDGYKYPLPVVANRHNVRREEDARKNSDKDSD